VVSREGLFGARLALIQAPMAGASGPELAIAAIDAGAIGSLPCALLAPDQMIAQATEVRSRSTGPLNLNFFCHRLSPPPDESAWEARLAPYYAEYGVGPPAVPPPLRKPFDDAAAEAVEQIRPEIVSFHFGLPPAPLLERVRRTGAKIVGNATSVAEAQWLGDRGCDAIIAQGHEAGGHAGYFIETDPATHMGLFALLPQIVDSVAVPVIAAGAIGDARGIAAARALGAAAVQIGTLFLFSPESLISAPYRDALASSTVQRTQFTNLFSGGLARGLPNRLMAELGAIDPVAPPFPHSSAALSKLRQAAEREGKGDFSPLWSGEAAALGKAMPARVIIAGLFPV
jgi:nitronate monooxygenase